ncbi:MAG TPA: hypothetical protein VLX28_04980, partial [Thermoanaerobaculia bacterium]|nr:hypothetical protein [Thermoanaerobaculia bacterium]
GGTEFFHLRARTFSSGLSPYVSLFLWAAAIYDWVLLEVKRRVVAARQFFAWPLRRPCEPPLVHCQTLARPLRQRLSEELPRNKTFWLVLLAVAVPPLLLLVATIQPIAESKIYGWIFIFLIAFGFGLSLLSFYRFIAVWLALQKILARISHTRLTQAFQRISPQVNWNPMKSFGWRMPNFDLVILSAEKVKAFLPQANSVDLWLEKAFEAERTGTLSDEIAARRNLDRTFSRACRVLAAKESEPAVADFLAIRLVVYIRYVFSHLRHCLTAALVSGLFLTAAVRAYTFEPKQFFSICLWMIMIPAIILTLWVFLEMDRNASLSAIAGTTPGRVTFDRAFFTNFLSYGLVPLLGVVVSQFPQISRLFVGWLNPLLHIAGAG